MHNSVDMVGLRNGDGAQWQLMVERYHPMLIRYAWRILGNQDDSEEVVQIVFTGLWFRRDHLPPILRLQSYLLVSVRNRCRSMQRQQASRPKPMGDGLDDLPGTDAGSLRYDPAVAAESAELTQILRGLAQWLTPAQKRVFIEICAHPEASSRTIGLALGCSHKNILTMLGRIRQRVNAQVAPYLNQRPRRPRQARPTAGATASNGDADGLASASVGVTSSADYPPAARYPSGCRRAVAPAAASAGSSGNRLLV